jgi:hypothetical protein
MKKNSQLEETLIKSAMLNLGIVPYTDNLVNIQKMLKNSSVEEKRKLFRKFRKLWRKLDAKGNNTKVFKTAVVVNDKGDKKSVKQAPSFKEKLRRRKIVLSYVKNALVKPIIDSVESMILPNLK